MAKKVEKKRALLSVYYKDGILEFAQGLQKLGWEIVSSGGTAKHLKENGMKNIVDVADITGLGPILGHRVVTLHPKIHGGILATADMEEELKELKISRIRLVCVDVYPVWEAINSGESSVKEVMEKTDIGGPAMLRAAAKNHEMVIPICEPEDREFVLEELQKHRDISLTIRQILAGKVFALTASYDASISRYFGNHGGIKFLKMLHC